MLSRISSFINERNSCGRERGGVNTREAAAARAGVCGAYHQVAMEPGDAGADHLSKLPCASLLLLHPRELVSEQQLLVRKAPKLVDILAVRSQ
jgi:hypothetical protein